MENSSSLASPPSQRRSTEPLVTVIIPTYNREKTIRRAVDSVLAQTYPSIELIVVDDGSSDRTVEVLSTYGSKLRVIEQRNAGPGAARNTGIRASSGAIISFLDSDDLWEPEKLSRQVRLMISTVHSGVVCCVSNMTMKYADGSLKTSFGIAGLKADIEEGLWLNPAEILLTRFLMFNQVVAVWRHALDKVGYFREDFRILEDFDLALRLAAAGPWAFIATPLATWHSGTESSLTDAAKLSDIARRVFDIVSHFRPPEGRHFRPLIRRKLAYLRWRLRAHRLEIQLPFGGRVAARSMLKLLACSEAVRRRLKSYPQMITAPVPAPTGGG